MSIPAPKRSIRAGSQADTSEERGVCVEQCGLQMATTCPLTALKIGWLNSQNRTPKLMTNMPAIPMSSRLSWLRSVFLRYPMAAA